MRPRPYRANRKGGEGGYALLMVIFMAATIMLFATVATLNVRTEGQREKEDELAWRGNQYVRAIRLYYKKNGHFPASMEDLTKYTSDQPRFIRQAYKDPMNRDDGSWRLIYVLPNGQFVGSVMHKGLQGSLAAQIQNPLGGNAANAQNGSQMFGPGQTTPPPGSTVGASGQTPASGQTSGTDQQDQSADQGPIFGGSIIGVASKMKQPSLRVYKDGKTYFEWEFIWDPTASAMGGSGGIPTGTPTGTQPGQPSANPQNPSQQNPQPQGTGINQ